MSVSAVHAIVDSEYPGVAELLVFHPVDTIAKRLMSNKSKVRLTRLTTQFSG